MLSNTELLCLLSSLLLLLSDSTLKSHLQFFTQYYPLSRRQPQQKRNFFLKVTWGWAKSHSITSSSWNSSAGCRSLLSEPVHLFSHLCCISWPWWHQGQILCPLFTPSVLYCSTHLKNNSCWQFQMMILFKNLNLCRSNCGKRSYSPYKSDMPLIST